MNSNNEQHEAKVPTPAPSPETMALVNQTVRDVVQSMFAQMAPIFSTLR